MDSTLGAATSSAGEEVAPGPAGPVGEVNECLLLSGFHTYIVQVSLGFLALSSLLVKRQLERPRRSLLIWMMDVSKQGIGALYGHVLNMLVAIWLPPSTNQCVWYFINYLVDTTLGTAMSLALLELIQYIAYAYELDQLEFSGKYGDPPNIIIWLYQLLAWLGIISIVKFLVLFFLYILATPLGSFGNFLFHGFEGSPMAELVFVMIVCPCLMNTMQFWVQDSFLKYRKEGSSPFDWGFLLCYKPEQKGVDNSELDKLTKPLVDEENEDIIRRRYHEYQL